MYQRGRRVCTRGGGCVPEENVYQRRMCIRGGCVPEEEEVYQRRVCTRGGRCVLEEGVYQRRRMCAREGDNTAAQEQLGCHSLLVGQRQCSSAGPSVLLVARQRTLSSPLQPDKEEGEEKWLEGSQRTVHNASV